MAPVRVLTALTIAGVLAAGALATAVNTQILGAVSAGAESSSESLRAAEEIVDPASVTPEQTAAAAAATQQQARTLTVPDSVRATSGDSTDDGRGSGSLGASGQLDMASPSVPEPTLTGTSGTASAASTPSPSDSASPSGSTSPSDSSSPSGSGSPSPSPSGSTSPSTSGSATATP